jgi:outer membrane protein OmpA-like peptidoglycan-associated protein
MWHNKITNENGAVPQTPKRLALIAAAGILSNLWTGVSFANVTGSDTQNFNPATNSEDFVTVYSTKTLGQGNYHLGLFVDYATNTLPYFTDTNATFDDSSKDYDNGITGANLGFGIGILDNLDLSLAIPYVLSQQVTDKGYRGQFKETGNTNILVSSKLRIWNNENFGLGLVAGIDVNRLKNNPYLGEDSNMVYNAQLVFDMDFDPLLVGFNVGYKFRNPGDPIPDSTGATPLTPFDSQVIASTAIAYRMTEKASVLAEIFGTFSDMEVAKSSYRDSSAAEMIAGFKYKFMPELTGQAGVGSELTHGMSTADLRIYAGIAWQVGHEATPPAPEPEVKAETAPASAYQTQKPDQHFVVNDVLFKFNSSELSHSSATKSLRSLSDVINGPKKIKMIVVEGHTCNMGSTAYNQKLSEDRARSIKNWLVSTYKMDPRQIIDTGYGESHPLASNATPEGRKVNRRVEFKIFFDKDENVAQK